MGKRTNDTKQYFDDYVLQNEKVYRRFADGFKAWVVPKNARMQICRLCHDDAGHLSVEKTLERIRSNYWFAGMRRFVTKYVQACLNCAYYKNVKGKKQGKLNPITKISVPFHTIHIDHVGPAIKESKDEIRNKKPNERDIFVRVSDTNNQTAFTARSFKNFCEAYGIKRILNAVAIPRANGQCERYNKTIVTALATTTVGKDSSRWDEDVKGIQSALNTCLNKGIGTTPTKALIGYETRSPAEGWLLSKIQEEVDRVDLRQHRERMGQHISESQKKQKEHYDRSQREATIYKSGDLVMVEVTSEAATGSSRKLLPKFKGPFRVTRVLSNDRYEVEDLREGSRGKRTVAAVDRLKRWITVQDDGDRERDE
ncbi:hypothetical protein KPH14_011865 [Odynerus spinipes]|uniref:RNA-directed DNA polymerase n=1 Tax=Odynerus spinipes TaxID=1348599 RepID=A0AAD9RDV8_9HYME|nr:hypothetical protein KPH14_011865 [Odynerus spinipes]